MARKRRLQNPKLFQMYLDTTEQILLARMADQEMRSRAEMGRLLIREAAERRGIRVEAAQAEAEQAAA